MSYGSDIIGTDQINFCHNHIMELLTETNNIKENMNDRLIDKLNKINNGKNNKINNGKNNNDINNNINNNISETYNNINNLKYTNNLLIDENNKIKKSNSYFKNILSSNYHNCPSKNEKKINLLNTEINIEILYFTILLCLFIIIIFQNNNINTLNSIIKQISIPVNR